MLSLKLQMWLGCALGGTYGAIIAFPSLVRGHHREAFKRIKSGVALGITSAAIKSFC